MLDKSEGAVGCAHCQEKGARVLCGRCGRLICDDCAASAGTCPEPEPARLQLAVDGAVVRVDREGKHALVPRDQTELMVIELESGLHYLLGQRLRVGQAIPELTSRGELLALAGSELLRVDIDSFAATSRLALPRAATPAEQLRLDEGEELLVVAGGRGLCAVDLASWRLRWAISLELGSARTICAARAAGLVLVGCDSGIVVCSSGGDHLGAVAADAPAEWIALRGDSLLSIGADRQLRCHLVAPGEAPGRWPLSWAFELPADAVTSGRRRGWRTVEAALNREGRALAVRIGRAQIGIYRPPDPVPAAWSRDHEAKSSKITLLRFGPFTSARGRAKHAREKQQLLSADSAGRVIIWPSLSLLHSGSR